MNKWNISAPKVYMDVLMTSKYFKKSLGQSLTEEKNDGRVLREGLFTSWYHKKTKALIFKQGEIGHLHFYVDHYLKKEILGFFLSEDPDKYQYAIEWDQENIDKIGIDQWLSLKLKEVDIEVEGGNKDNNSSGDQSEGDPNKLRSNPGGVSWKDIEEYYKQKKNI